MAPWDFLFAVKESDPRARIQAFIDGYKMATDYEVCPSPTDASISGLIHECSLTKPVGIRWSPHESNQSRISRGYQN